MLSRFVVGMAGLVAILISTNEVRAADISFTLKIHVLNLKGVPLELGAVDDVLNRPLLKEDLELRAIVFSGQQNVDRLVNATEFTVSPDNSKAGGSVKSNYSINLKAPDDSQVVRVKIELPGRQVVDLARIAAVDQTISVSMPAESPKRSCCCNATAGGCRRSFIWRRCR